jgi:hypothetical protein
MSQLKELLDQEAYRIEADQDALESTLRRRDHKRRNQRIAAGVVGIAVFVAAIWIVTSVGSLDRSETPAVPGPAETGLTGSPDAEWDGFDLPPEGAVPSSPETGNVIARCCSDQLFGSVFVYADGRVITSRAGRIVEQRLTPEGIDLVRSGAVEPRRFLRPAGPSLPAGAWADPDARSYVPSRYAVCYAAIRALHPPAPPDVAGEMIGYVDPSRVVSLLPAQAQDLLRGKERDRGDGGRLRRGRRCSELTTEEARTLEQILLDAGFEGFVTPEWAEAFGDEEDGAAAIALLVERDLHVGDEVWISMSCNPLFPHGLGGERSA